MQVHCSVTGRDIVADVELVRIHLASDKYSRAARAAGTDFAQFEVRLPGTPRALCAKHTEALLALLYPRFAPHS